MLFIRFFFIFEVL